MQANNTPIRCVEASDSRRIPSNHIAAAIAARHQAWDEREAAWAIIEPLDYSPCVRLLDHVADPTRYRAPGLDTKTFHSLNEIREFFGPLEAASESFSLDRLSVCAAFAEHSERVFHLKSEAGAIDARELYETLSDRIDVLEMHICSSPCRSVEDIQHKVTFALEHLTCDDTDSDLRNEIFKSIRAFGPECDDTDTVTGLQVAALEAVAEQLG